jgi:hypothetical protein
MSSVVGYLSRHERKNSGFSNDGELTFRVNHMDSTVRPNTKSKYELLNEITKLYKSETTLLQNRVSSSINHAVRGTMRYMAIQILKNESDYEVKKFAIPILVEVCQKMTEDPYSECIDLSIDMLLLELFRKFSSL